MVLTPSRSSSDVDLLQIRARAELERRRRQAGSGDPFHGERFDAAGYIRRRLGWQPWSGGPETPGQAEVIAAYETALRQQHERAAYEAGRLRVEDLRDWQPGQVIQNRLRIEAGHGVGKTKLASGLVNHFFDCFPPAIVYTFAPTYNQIHDLLWKEIKADRTGKGLPGRILDLKLDRGPDHFAIGRATSDAGGRGTERVQGQHGPYLLFVLDEAEGVADFVYDAVDSMASGGIVIVLLLANPRTRTSRFHKAAASTSTWSCRLSCLHHPNVTEGREVVPGAVRRDYVEAMLAKHCAPVPEHDPDRQTFALPWQPDAIYAPDPEFMFRVLGVAPLHVADNTLIPVGRYEAACTRATPLLAVPDLTTGRIGVDVARWGADLGTIYVRHAGVIRRAAQLARLDTLEYVARIKDEAAALARRGVTSLHVRVDGGGGFGGGVVDLLRADTGLRQSFADFDVIEVHFGGSPYEGEAFADLATELYAAAGEVLRSARIADPPGELEADLCERVYTWALHKGVAVKRLEPKDAFKKRQKRSPDDGDGFVLAAAPDHLFGPGPGVWLS